MTSPTQYLCDLNVHEVQIALNVFYYIHSWKYWEHCYNLLFSDSKENVNYQNSITIGWGKNLSLKLLKEFSYKYFKNRFNTKKEKQ